MRQEKQRVAVIGAGVSGIAAANVWQKCGYEVIIYEAGDQVGGQWAKAYPGVTLQNTSPQYVFADFPWPFTPDRHPTGEQILRYINEAVAHFGLDVRLRHRVLEMLEETDGWTLRLGSEEGESSTFFDYVVVAVGQYPADNKSRPRFPGEENFQGKIIHSVWSQDQFAGQKVVVLGNGKTALDMASLAGETAESAVQIVRTPRWSIPDYLLGIDYTRPFFSRFGSIMMPSWVYPNAMEKVLHHVFSPVVWLFWRFIAALFRFEHTRHIKGGSKAKAIVDPLFPPASQLVPDLRSASALAPKNYFPQVASGDIRVCHTELVGFTSEGIELANGETIPCDTVALCVGNDTPIFPFLPQKYRDIMETPVGGAPLYRHLIHPDIPNVGFAGLNHGFLHIALAEMGTLWQVAAHRGELQLPSKEEMKTSAAEVAAWKTEHQSFEPSCNYAVSTRFQQYLDVILKDLGISPYRKLPNVPAEIFARYSPADYQGVVELYLKRAQKRQPRLVPKTATT